MLTWFSSWMLGPGLFLGGALLVAAPIVIHLLNKRKFKVVDWAAMDFLLDADKRNRRRVRLEDLLLLLLRCLAVLLIGLLLARPFLPTGLTAGLLDTAQFERIVLLDDSLSMQVRMGNQSAMDDAKQNVIEMVRDLAGQRSDDTLTLILTSQPDQRRLNADRISTDSLGELIDVIDRLEATDKTANLDVALGELERYLASEPKNVNRVVYILTDLRERDWESENRPSAENHPVNMLRRLANMSSGCFLIDVAADGHNNLVISQIKPEDTLVAGVSSRFDVSVTNLGDREVRDLTVKFTAGDALPLSAPIERIAAGGSASVPFSFTFAPTATADHEGFSDQLGQQSAETSGSVRVRAEVMTDGIGQQDRLPADSERFFAARVVNGIPTLIVDGDPSASYGRAESFYLNRALAPPGQSLSGIAPEVIVDTELEAAALRKYQVIFLCNTFRLSEQSVAALQQWVSAGGGLVLMPGDQVDEESFNDQFYRGGKGLSPIRLDGPRGDETERSWVHFQVRQSNHPVLRVFEGQNNPFLDHVKIFRWWGSEVLPEQLGSAVSVAAVLTDTQSSAAMAEKNFGDGRVMATAVPADADWSTWPDDPSYLIAMQELVRHMSANRAGSGEIAVGEPIREPLDLTQYRIDASLRGPSDNKTSLQAVPRGGKQDDTPAVWLIDYPETSRRGFYELQLERNDGAIERLLFAANVEPSEGNLRRADVAALRRELGDAPVTIVSGNAAAPGVRGTQHELWKSILAALIALLCGEQLLAWVFGLRR